VRVKKKNMDLPFTREQFLSVFRDYNTAIWPAQPIAYLLGLGSVELAATGRIESAHVSVGWTISLILSLFWLWTGVLYHLVFFRPINPAAALFGGIFIIQSVLFFNLRNKLCFAWQSDVYGHVGAILILYALVVYPMIGAALRRVYPDSPTFGVTPCPMTIFTFGMLLWTSRDSFTLSILVIPMLWSLVGFMAALRLEILEDIGLLIAGLVATSMLTLRSKRIFQPPNNKRKN
jgi:hypothetical protein